MAPGISAQILIPTSGLSSALPVEHHKHHHFRTIVFATSETPMAPNCRPAVILPGLGNNSSDYQKLQLTLKHYGVPSLVANVSRIDWLRNAAGLTDPNYWGGTLRPIPVLDWYLKRVDEAVCQTKVLAQGGGFSIIGHSAGGWLARVYMAEYGISDVSLLLTLGTPHMPPPKGSRGVVDQTRGLLNYVERYCARAVYTPQLKYVCIAGRYIRGAPFFGNSRTLVSTDNKQPMTEMTVLDKALAKEGQARTQVDSIDTTNRPMSFASTARARFIGQGYKQVCGQADVWGDGVVPEVSAHLEGALNVSLDGVYHSPVGSDDTTRPWYGSPAVVAKWVHHLLS